VTARVIRVAALLASALAVALAGVLGTAAAVRTVRIATHVTIKSDGLTFSGRVTSSNAACQGQRRVTLYREPSQALASTTTRASGRWKITASGSAGISLGRFYARVAQRSDGTAGTIYVCGTAKSATIAFSQPAVATALRGR
jgi:hypothetical protein